MANLSDYDPDMVARAREIAASIRATSADPDAAEGLRQLQQVVVAYGKPAFVRLTQTALDHVARTAASDAAVAEAAALAAEIARLCDTDTDGGLVLSDAAGRPVGRLGLAEVPAGATADATLAALGARCGPEAARDHFSRLLSMYVHSYRLVATQFPELTRRLAAALGCDVVTPRVDPQKVSLFLLADAPTRCAIVYEPTESAD